MAADERHHPTTDSAADTSTGPAGSTAGQTNGQTAAWTAFATVDRTVQQLMSPNGHRRQTRPGHPAPTDQTAGSTADTGVSSVDVLAALAGLRALQDQLAVWEPVLIGAARDRGASWATIAPALGLASRQAAERRYLRLNPHTTDPEGMTGEQRVQAARDRRAGDRAVTRWARDNAGMLRRLAAQITALDNLAPDTQQTAERLLHALGDSDTATLLGPLAEAGSKLEDSHPKLAGQVSDINDTTDQLRTGHTSKPQ
ncbi:hypothetical protein [Kribbella sp. NPDC000426]|uniref:hypothetical protein n=1 Tax=Kribbella sp. NPDC000426 TaxID=3154255 RepID=UPI00331FFF28